jgi:integrase
VQDADAAPSLALEEGIERYLEAHVRPNYRPRSAHNTERLLTLYAGALSKKLMVDLKSNDFTDIFDTLQPSEANHAFGALRTFFRWAERRDYCSNPLSKLEAPAKSKSRERVLTENELKAVWHACPDDSFGSIVKLLILTGQRRGEIAAIEAAWFQNDHLWFPAHITKNGEAHTIPLSARAQQILVAAFKARNAQPPPEGR